MSALKKHDIFQAIADPTRREVLKLLAEKERPISEITAQFDMSRTAIAKHLHVLSDADLVVGKKVGREKRYSLQPEPLKELKQWLSYFDRYWDNKLSRLKHVVEHNNEENRLKVIEKEK